MQAIRSPPSRNLKFQQDTVSLNGLLKLVFNHAQREFHHVNIITYYV